ncbi:MAG: hypothetical protein F4X13_12885 [Gammaproteobacteria bacterium]|nr:hypothetical protein [Gammaproteobacteria bacterium]
MRARVFMKRLAAVEIDPARSNQHEFNAGRLRQELGLRGDPCQGAVEFLFYKADDAEPAIVTESYTLYDARRNHPTRTEWRMYYTNRGVARHARAGDLMLLFRLDIEATDLIAVVARRGTTVERALTRLLAGVDPEELVDSRFVDSKAIDLETRRLLLRVHRRPEVQADINTYASASHPLFQRAASDGRMPRTAEMASAALDIVSDMGITEERPDEFIDLALRAETALFMAIEEMLGNKGLVELQMTGNLDFHAAMRLTMSFQQSRRSRRGQSLENHFLTLLERLRIPYGYQCTTEPGKKPDFVFPSCDAYHDPTFPSDRLRMVGCKTRVRERHAQWLDEAARIPLKFALCVDDGLTDALVSRYEGRLRFFMPAQLLHSTYAVRAIRHLLGSVTDLIGELRPEA